MRTLWFLAVAVLLFPSTVLAAKKGPSIPGSSLGALDGGWRGLRWDCADTRLDGRDNRDVGLLGCVTDYGIDPITGTTVLAFEIVDEPKGPRDLDDYAFTVTLDQGPLDRSLTDFELVELTDDEATLSVLHRPENGVRRRVRVAFTFFTWAPELAIRKIKLKQKGSPALKWSVDGDLSWPGGRITRPARVDVRVPDAAGTCTWTDVSAGGARKIAKHLEDNVVGSQLQVRAIVAGNDDAVVRFVLPDPQVEVSYDGGRLVVRGAERAVYTLPRVDEDPRGPGNEFAWEFDGQDLLVRLNGATYGPFYVRRREWSRARLRWDLEIEGGATIRALEVTPCAQEARPEPPERDEPVAERVPEADESRPVKRKKGPSALEVLAGVQKGMAIGQGVAAAAESGVDAANTMGSNVSAMQEGRYEDMESMDYQVNVGADGHVESSYSKSKVTQNADGSYDVHGEGTYVDTRSGTVARGSHDTRITGDASGVGMTTEGTARSTSGSEPPAGRVAVVASVDSGFGGGVEINGSQIPQLRGGAANVKLLLPPGEHRVRTIDSSGRTIQEGSLRVGSNASTLTIDARGRLSSPLLPR